jgi:pyrroloquinoline-quinone synthase
MNAIAAPINALASALSPPEFIEQLRATGEQRYHDRHHFHVRMHAGTLSKRQIQAWVENRYYYQTRIPIKDALLLAKSEDPAFRRSWMRRIADHDGRAPGEGGIAQWEKLAAGVGLDIEILRRHQNVLPSVRFACDAYVNFVRDHSLLEAVASSLTEFFSPDIMTRRVLAWEQHYPWVEKATLDYFRGRVQRARVDSQEAIALVSTQATSAVQQAACVAALIRKCDILWALLDAVELAYPQ